MKQIKGKLTFDQSITAIATTTICLAVAIIAEHLLHISPALILGAFLAGQAVRLTIRKYV